MKLALSKKATKDELDEVDDCVKKKVPKKTLWIALWAIFVVVMIPLFVTGIQVWSQQSADELRYAKKEKVHKLERDHTSFKATQEHIREDLNEIKESQRGTRQDVQEILRHLRK